MLVQEHGLRTVIADGSVFYHPRKRFQTRRGVAIKIGKSQSPLATCIPASTLQSKATPRGIHRALEVVDRPIRIEHKKPRMPQKKAEGLSGTNHSRLCKKNFPTRKE